MRPVVPGADHGLRQFEGCAALQLTNIRVRTKTQFVPRSYANALHDSAWYQSLPPAKQARLNDLIQGAGYGGNALSMAFPYMSPDNNNTMFAGTMADQFIVNNNGAAAKNKSQYDPNANK